MCQKAGQKLHKWQYVEGQNVFMSHVMFGCDILIFVNQYWGQFKTTKTCQIITYIAYYVNIG